MKTAAKKLFGILMGLSMASVGHTYQSLSDWPLASQTIGSYPNVLFLVDDSGSMDTTDVFYAPGFDNDNTYACTGGTVITSVPGQTVQINVVNDYSGGGKPYFIYNGSRYGWGPSGTAVDENRNVLNRACFSTNADYNVKFREYSTATMACGAGFSLASDGNCYQVTNLPTVPAYCEANFVLAEQQSDGTDYCWWSLDNGVIKKKNESYQCKSNKNFGSKYTEIYYTISGKTVTCGRTSSGWRTTPITTGSCPIGYSDITVGGNDKCGNSSTSYKPYQLLTPNTSLTAETQSGNFLNWYLSNTEARYSSGNLLPGYAGYDASGNQIANDTGLPWTQIPADNFALADSSSGYDSKKGNKPIVHWNHERMAVADDIGKMLTRKITNVRLALGSFWTDGAGTKKSSEGWLLHEFADLSIAQGDAADPLVIASKTRANANRVSLITEWEKIDSGSGTPTSESIVRMARYFFQGWETETFAYFNKVDAATAPAPQTTARKTTSKAIQDVLTLGKQSTTSTVRADENTSGKFNAGKIITADRWCEKNAIAVLTDGQPTSDTSYAGSGPLGSYDTYGTNKEDYSSDDYKGIIRVPGALYDHDWLPSVRDKQNIETFFIAFGAASIISDVVFKYAGLAGGGGTENSYPATSGSAVLDAFKTIIQRVSADNLGISAVAVSSTATLKQNNYAFQATYNTEYYTTDLIAINLNINGEFTEPNGSNPSRNSEGITPLWNAGTQLSNKYVVDDISPAPDVRKRLAYTWNAANSGTKGMRFGTETMTRPSTPVTAFAAFSALPANIQNDLSTLTGSDAQQRYDLMMFLLGDTKNEKNHPSTNTPYNEKYRQRGVYADTDGDGLVDKVTKGGIFADSVNSSPIFVKEPLNPLDDLHFGTTTNNYSKFKAMQANRPAMLYVGANDGMLHGISVEAVTKNTKAYAAGDELFAYIPTQTASSDINRGLHYLAVPDYDHLMYVDQTPTIRDVFVDLYTPTAAKTPEWRTMLVGGLGKGGKGYYALDITCPVVDSSLIVPPGGTIAINNTCSNESFNESNVLWEFSDANDVDMGYSFSRPIIAKVKYDKGLSAANDPLADNGARWAIITGNGYNSANGRAVLYIIFLDGGLDGSWTEGSDYLKIYTSTALADTAANSNGLSSPTALDTDNDGAMDRVYAGDLKGHMWVFDLSATATSAQYALPILFPWKPKLLFTTGWNSATPQPITTPPIVQRDLTKTRILPTTDPDLMVMFGTGQYLGIPDLTDTSVQTLYAVHDRGTYNLARYGNVPSTSFKILEPRIFTEVNLNDAQGKIVKNREITGNAINPVQFGWYVDFASDIDKNGVILGKAELTGERLATDMARLGPTLLMNTTVPVTGSCEGSTQSYSAYVDWTTGLAPKQAFYDANNDGIIDSQDLHYVGQFNAEGSGQVTVAGTNVISQSGGSATSGKINPQTIGFSQRIGWEEKLPYGLKGQ